MTLRPFSADDYEAIAAVYNAAEPDYPSSVDELREHDATRGAGRPWLRWVAEEAGEIRGYGMYFQSDWAFHPDKYHLFLVVHPERRCQGVGGALYRRIVEELAPRDPLAFKAHTREDRTHSVGFLARRGFAETMREFESRLDVAAFDPAPFSGAEERVRQSGVRLTTFAQLRAEEGEVAARKLYALDEHCAQDVPHDDPPTQPPFAVWKKKVLEGPGFRPEAFFLAVAPDGAYVGVSMLFHPQGMDALETGLTGVHRDWRRHGIATALKLRAIAYAKSVGAPTIRTENATTNRAMLSINEALGFVKQPAWISYEKTFRAA